MVYIRRCYIPHLFHQLIEKYNIYSSVIQLNSSVIIDEYVMFFYSAPPSLPLPSAEP
jgi:hypothetical protein